MIRMLAIMLFIQPLIGCVTKPKPISFGVSERFASFIPARIAVLPCQRWPELIRYRGLPQSNFDPAKMDEICQATDNFIREGFRNQPFMRGYSTIAVKKLLARAKKPQLIAQLQENWKPTIDCAHCTNVPTYYQTMMANDQQWRLLLQDFRASTRNADAVLVPFVLYGVEQITKDRGLWAAQRVSAVVFLLIGTDSGQLIWSGGREAQLTKQERPEVSFENIDYPELDLILDRLLVEDIWRQFPGRLFLK
jgi:hypothetical protein